jgi:FkbM family methyltransferase
MYYGVPLRARRLRRFYSRFVTPGSLCFDVGAHAGNRVRCWLELGARVVAVEPQADFVRLLQRFYGRNPNVEIVPAALGRTVGAATLLVSERTPTVTTLSRTWVDRVREEPSFARVRWDGEQRVDVLTLQTLISRFGRPQFVKIDVEGYEAEVLAGLDVAVPSLSFELLPAARAVALDCVHSLAALGDYRFNWSTGESHRMLSADWVDAHAVRGFIERLPADSPSGDVYAVLEQDGARGARCAARA